MLSLVVEKSEILKLGGSPHCATKGYIGNKLIAFQQNAQSPQQYRPTKTRSVAIALNIFYTMN